MRKCKLRKINVEMQKKKKKKKKGKGKTYITSSIFPQYFLII